MRVSAVYSCVRPDRWRNRRNSNPCLSKNRLTNRQRIDHDYWWLLNERPCAPWSAAQFWEWVVWQVLLRGDSICYLDRNREGKVVNIIPFSRSQVRIQKLHGDPRKPYRLAYFFQTDQGAFGADQGRCTAPLHRPLWVQRRKIQCR